MEKHYEEVPVGLLKVDKDMDSTKLYMQRDEIRPWIDKLKADWDPEKFLPAIVSQRADGTYVIIDGQHSTKAAMEKVGPKFLRDCMVYTNATPQQEAKLFLAANKNRKPVRPYDNFRVALTAGDEIAHRVDQEVRAVGVEAGKPLEISGSPSTYRVGAVQALLTLGKTPGMIKRVLTTASRAWGFDTSTWDNLILRALGMLLDMNWDQVDDDRLVKVLHKGGTPALWKQNSVRLTTSGGGSTSRSYPMVKLVVSDYNEGLKPDKMLVTKGKSKTLLAA